jgi:ABC-type glycerol-3-phosphate transport system substrate-binding protein
MHHTSMKRSRLKRQFATMCSLLALFAVFFAACSNGSNSTSSNGSAASNSNAPITIWIDADRKTAIDEFKKAFPAEASKINAVVVDRNQFPAKVLLENNINKGWPDVVFAEPDLVAQVSDAAHHFPLDLSPYVSADIQKNFAGLDSCRINGKLVCLRNDLAQFVLWYNAPLMKQFGYTIPTTWEEYQDLGLRVAKEHPGYIIGEFADAFVIDEYFWTGQCPLHQVTGNTLYTNLASPKCTRVANMLDTLLPTGVLSKKSGYFDAGMTTLGNQNKILMLPGPSWMAQAVFKGTYYKTADHQLAAAAPLKWQADTQAYTGALGGAAWTVSNHTKNVKLAVDFVKWVTTSPVYLGHAANFPAYLPVANVWAQTVASDPIFASDPYPVLKQAATEIDPTYSYVRFDDRTIFGTSVVTPVITSGATVLSKLPSYQSQLTALAEAQGYQVSNTAP